MSGTGSTPSREPEPPDARRGALFASTHWSVVVAAGESDSEQSRRALETLCRAYWYPVYAYVRRKRRDLHEAQDLTQEFFTRVLEKHYLRSADRRRGRFRSFLLASLEHFLAKEWNRAHRLKRGGGLTFFSIEGGEAESRFLHRAAGELPPERHFEREWALAVVDQGVAQLRGEYEATGRGEVFESLRPFLTTEATGERYAELATRLESTPAALRVAVHRLRQRYAQCVREVIAGTVASQEEVEAEVLELLRALK